MLRTRQGLSSAAIEQLINQHVAYAVAAYEANQSNRNATQNEASGSAGGLRKWNPCSTLATVPQTLEIDEAYEMSWKDLIKLMIEVYCSRNEIQKLESELENLSVKGTNVAGYTRRFQELSFLCPRMVLKEEDKIKRYVLLLQEMLITKDSGKMSYTGTLPLCDKCKLHHHGPCPVRCGNSKKVGHQARDCWTPTLVTCYGCRGKGHTKRYYPGLENQNGDEEARQNLDIVTGTFLLENHYIPVLTNASANKSFVFTAISISAMLPQPS
ncbi:putative reverse transcriptase domain-containing protein [Tanacetum coccineum]